MLVLQILKTRWPPRPQIGSDIFDFSSETTEWNSTKLEGSKISTSSTKFVVQKGGTLYSGTRYIALWVSCYDTSHNDSKDIIRTNNYEIFFCISLKKMCFFNKNSFISRNNLSFIESTEMGTEKKQEIT